MTPKTSTPKTEESSQSLPNDDETPKSTEEELDKALADSFPASDPPAPVITGTTASPQSQDKTRDKKVERP